MRLGRTRQRPFRVCQTFATTGTTSLLQLTEFISGELETYPAKPSGPQTKRRNGYYLLLSMPPNATVDRSGAVSRRVPYTTSIWRMTLQCVIGITHLSCYSCSGEHTSRGSICVDPDASLLDAGLRESSFGGLTPVRVAFRIGM